MVLAHTHPKALEVDNFMRYINLLTYLQKVTKFKSYRVETDGRTYGRTEAIVLSPVLRWSVNIGNRQQCGKVSGLSLIHI